MNAPAASNLPKPARIPADPFADKRELLAAINRVMIEVDYVRKQRGEGLGYTYAGEAAIVGALHESFAKNGLCIKPVNVDLIESGTYETKHKTVFRRTVLRVTYKMSHVSGQHDFVMAMGEGADPGDKSFAKAMTMAFKYVLRESFMIETGDDPDKDPSDAAQPKGSEQPRQQGGGNQRPPQGQQSQQGNRPQGGNQSGNGQRPQGQQGDGQRPPQNQGQKPAGQQQPNGDPTNPQVAFARRVKAVPIAADMEKLNHYRSIWAKDGTMTKEMKAELEKLYWIRSKELKAIAEAASQGSEPEPEGGYGGEDQSLFPEHIPDNNDAGAMTH